MRESKRFLMTMPWAAWRGAKQSIAHHRKSQDFLTAGRPPRNPTAHLSFGRGPPVNPNDGKSCFMGRSDSTGTRISARMPGYSAPGQDTTHAGGHIHTRTAVRTMIAQHGHCLCLSQGPLSAAYNLQVASPSCGGARSRGEAAPRARACAGEESPGEEPALMIWQHAGRAHQLRRQSSPTCAAAAQAAAAASLLPLHRLRLHLRLRPRLPWSSSLPRPRPPPTRRPPQP